MDLVDFKEKCINQNPDITVQEFIIDGKSFFFEKIKTGEEFKFKREIANMLNVHIRDIVIVGSGKLGFSLKPDKSNPGLYLFKNFDFDYSSNIEEKKSDLDVAIVSSSLFDKEIENLFNYTQYGKDSWKERRGFAKYTLKGKLAIRFLPDEFPMTKEILKVQEKYQLEYGREVNIEIYKSWYFFETYHRENIKNIQVNIIN